MNGRKGINSLELHDQAFADYKVEPVLPDYAVAVRDWHHQLPLERDSHGLKFQAESRLVDGLEEPRAKHAVD